MNFSDFLYVCAVAKNPYSPGVGTRPPYLAGRNAQVQRFRRMLEDYPEKRRNLRITGLRGVGKTVLLKEFEWMAKQMHWVVIRHELSPRLLSEHDFVIAVSDYLREALEAMSTSAKIKNLLRDAAKAITQIGIELGDGTAIRVTPTQQATKSVLEDRLSLALKKVGEVARAQDRGVLFLFDEAHFVYDRPRDHQFPLGALLSAFVAAQDEDEKPLPVMLVLCGLPPLTANIHHARSNAERLFRAQELDNLPLGAQDSELSEAALALVKPAADEGSITFDPKVADQIAHDVNGYPYFVQWFGEALWENAEINKLDRITKEIYESHKTQIQLALDAEFFEPRYQDARAADQQTLRVAASLGDERFTKRDIDKATTRSAGALAESLRRLIADNLVYRDDHGVYAYTAPLFGEYLRRCHPRRNEDR